METQQAGQLWNARTSSAHSSAGTDDATGAYPPPASFSARNSQATATRGSAHTSPPAAACDPT